ncbi:MAG: hypothetical protein SPD11_00460 [Sphaerochaetaceae bacterium]|nr:hypothetical protein [Sphaerochaetaceae bacterium]
MMVIYHQPSHLVNAAVSLLSCQWHNDTLSIMLRGLQIAMTKV